MTSRLRRNQSQRSAESISERIDSAILWIAVGMLFIIPLIFSFSGFVAVFSELKLVTLHIGAGMIAVLWLWQSAITTVNSRSTRASGKSLDLFRWVGKDPSRWLIVAASGWLIAQIISTLLSPLPVVSLFGADDARSGYNLYDNISFFVLFITVATRFRSEYRLKILIVTLISSGTLAAAYGIAQHFGWDPLSESAGRTRVWSSFGNPLNFGAYMVMAIPATLAMGIPNRSRKYLWMGVLAIAVGLQLAGLWYSGGRGPYVSFVAALIAFGLIGLVIGQVRALATSGAMLAAGVLIALIIIVAPSPQEDIGLERVRSIGDQIVGVTDPSTKTTGDLDARFDIWRTTLQTAMKWDVPQNESALSATLRPLFGLGPDMYIYAYPLAADPQIDNALVDHPHNYGLQILMEQGYIGLSLLVAMIALVLASIYKLVTRIRSKRSELWFSPVLILAIFPAVLGKLVEMQTGVSRVSDLAMTFALFGAVLAIWVVSSRRETAGSPLKSSRPVKSEPPKSILGFTLPPIMVSGAVIFSAMAATAIVLVTLGGWDIRRTSASRGWAAALTATTDIERATGWFESQELAPERPSFTNTLFVELFNAAVDQHESGNEDSSFQLMHTARNLLLEFEKRDPYKRDNQINLFKTEIVLTQWGQTEFAPLAVDRSRTIFKLYPAYPSLLSIIASDMTLIGRDDLAAEYNDFIEALR